MASSMSAAMVAEVEGLHRVHITLDLTIGGTTLRLAKESVASLSAGEYTKKVVSFGRLPRSTGFPAFFGIQEARVTITLEDVDGVIQNLLGGLAAGDVRGSTAKLTLRSFYVDASDHYTLFDGVVVDYPFTDADQRVYRFVLERKMNELQGKLKIPRADEVLWPNIPDENRNRAGQMVFGVQATPPGSSSTGMVECFMVDTTADSWYVSYGSAVTIDAVYVNGTLHTNNAPLRPDPSGLPHTLVNFSASQPNVDDTVTVDVTGMSQSGDANTAPAGVEERPAHVLEIVLANLVFNSWPDGATKGVKTAGGQRYLWLDATADPINTALVDACDNFMARNSQVFAGVLTSDMTGLDFLSLWSESFQVPVFWDTDFKVAPAAFDYGIRDGRSAVTLYERLRDIKSLSGMTYGDQERSVLELNWLLDSASGRFLRREVVQALGADDESRDSLDLTFARASIA